MRKLILRVAVSLDSLIEGPNGEIDWCFTTEDHGIKEFFKQVDTVFIGRKTYELMLSMGENASPGFPKFKQYIFSTTLDKVKGEDVLIRENVELHVESIKTEKGKDIWLFGGGTLTSSLMNLGLVDEVWLGVHPVVLGAGRPLFANLKERVRLKLFENKVYSSGLVFLKYAVE